MITKSSRVRLAVRATVQLLAAGIIAAGSQAFAQAPAPAKSDSLETIPVRIDVVLTRLQGEKKISSLPFTLVANARESHLTPDLVSMRMGIDVPIGATTETNNQSVPVGSGATRSTQSTSTRTQYRSVGTDIDCWAQRLDESRFSVKVSISDSSIYSPEGEGKPFKNLDPAAFRTFSTGNNVVMRDGQTVLFGTGTDKISGETLKIEVTLHVVK